MVFNHCHISTYMNLKTLMSILIIQKKLMQNLYQASHEVCNSKTQTKWSYALFTQII